MILTMILVLALLAGAAVLASMQATSTRGAALSRRAMTALYCAESGLTLARALVANNYPSWNASLGVATEPAWLAGLDHDLDGDGTGDFTITLRDNDDEASVQDLGRDNDLSIFVVSTCIQDPEVPTRVTELVRYLDRVAFVPKDLALAYAQRHIDADAFDRYRATCEHAWGPVGDGTWLLVIDALCTRALALGVRI